MSIIDQYKTILTSVQLTSASTSLIASSAITVMIALPRNGGLSSPYRRIIFGLSISDVIQSLGYTTGPFSVPSNTNPLGLGNDGTCQANGFLITLGASAVPMYTCVLCFYYLCKLKWRMPDATFRLRYERYLHILIPLFNLIVAFVALGLDTYHPTLAGTFCHFASTPRNCRFMPEVVGECEPNIKAHADMLQLVVSTVLPLTWLLIIAVIMTILFCHAITWKRMFRGECSPIPSRPSVMNSDIETNNDNTSEEEPQRITNSDSLENVQYLSRLYRKESLIQATCYVGGYLIVYLPVLIIYTMILLKQEVPPILALVAIALYPLGGLFNILIYTRPNVAALRRKHPEYSRLLAIWMVLKSGGETPEDDDVAPTFCCCAAINGPEERNSFVEVDDEPRESFQTDLVSVRTPSFNISDRISSTDIPECRKPETDDIVKKGKGCEIQTSSDSASPSKYRYYKWPEGIFPTQQGDDTQPYSCPDVSSGVNSSHITFSSRQLSSFSNFGTSSLAVVEEECHSELSEDIESSVCTSDSVNDAGPTTSVDNAPPPT